MAINRALLSGNLVRDAELRTTGSTSTLTFTIAVDEYRKDADNYVNFIDCVLFGSRAEALSVYMVKGRRIAVDGRMHQSRWEKDGQNRSRIEVYVTEVVFMDNGRSKEQATELYAEDIPF